MSAAIEPEALYGTPNALAPHYSRFHVAERLLLTGHSHQAWPDCARAGQIRAWDDAAELADRKWERAFARADRVRDGWRILLDDPRGDIVLGASTHDLVVRLLSALPLRQRGRVVTTDGEFHTLRRQLDRLAEEGLEVVRVPAEPVESLATRLAGAADERTALVAVSCVLFRSARIVPELRTVMARCEAVGTELLIDAYHALNVMPFSLPQQGLGQAFVIGGGYKYCQLGEGNCFLRLRPDCQLRPIVTGWYAEFDALAGKQSGSVKYGPGAARFAGATYDPTSHYRAAEVFDFFAAHGLTPAVLRQVSQHQVELLATAFDALDLDPRLVARDREVAITGIGGFLCLQSPRAGDLSAALFARGVYTDYRDQVLRLGPAPYLCDAQLRQAIGLLGEAAAQLER